MCVVVSFVEVAVILPAANVLYGRALDRRFTVYHYQGKVAVLVRGLLRVFSRTLRYDATVSVSCLAGRLRFSNFRLRAARGRFLLLGIRLRDCVFLLGVRGLRDFFVR